jgi:hypothetical protein
MKRRVPFLSRMSMLACLLLLVAAAALAHGDEQHVIGTVAKMTVSAITVKTVAGDMVTVAVVASVTEFTHGTEAAKFADLKVGDRVVIHAMKHGDQLMAHTVQFAAPAAPIAPAAKK